MQPSIEYFQDCVSGRYYEMRTSDSYQVGGKERISLFQTADGRWFRESAMPVESKGFVIGVLGQTKRQLTEEDGRAAGHAILQLHETSAAKGNAHFASFQMEVPCSGTILVKGIVENSGQCWWFGWGTRPESTDAIGLRFIDDLGHLTEARIQFPFECIAPGVSHRFEQAFSIHDIGLSPQSYRVEVGMVREGKRWFGEAPASTSLVLDAASIIEPLEYHRGISSGRSLAFTFDGGSSARLTGELLDVLIRHDIRCTMFLTGKFISRFPDVVRRMEAEGHEIANHTMTHPRLCFDSDPAPCPEISYDVLSQELKSTAELYLAVTGKEMTRLWRAPYGHRNSLVLLWARIEGYRHVFWGYDSKDWRVGLDGIAPYTAARMKEEASEFLRSSEAASGVLLFHLASASAVDVAYPHIDALIGEAMALGYRLTTVGAMLNGR